jgi:hypothetical protein
MGFAVDQAHGVSAVTLPLFIGQTIGAGAIFGREHGTFREDFLGRSDCLACRHGRNVF